MKLLSLMSLTLIPNEKPEDGGKKKKGDMRKKP